MDEFPPGPDRPLFFKLTAEVPVQQETLLRIFLIGMAKSLPLNGQVNLLFKNIYVMSQKYVLPSGLSDDRGDADHAGGGSAPAGQQGLPGAELRQGRGLHGVRVAADSLHIPGVHLTAAGLRADNEPSRRIDCVVHVDGPYKGLLFVESAY